jgi:hypothetical protein
VAQFLALLKNNNPQMAQISQIRNQRYRAAPMWGLPFGQVRSDAGTITQTDMGFTNKRLNRFI